MLAFSDGYADNLLSCNSLAEVSEVFRKAVDAHGYTASAARAFIPSETGMQSRFLFRNWSSAWAKMSDEKGNNARSFVVAEARKRIAPFTWSEITAARSLSSSEKQVLHDARAFGWFNGFVLPVHGPGGYFAIVSMASPERDLDLRFERLFYLQTIAQLAHERSCALGDIAVFASLDEELTARELECMRWVAAGRTDEQIGKIMSISVATVKFHINGARQKLGARNRAQAAARLVLSGLL